MMIAKKVKYFSALFHAVLAITCLIVQFFLGFITSDLMIILLFMAPVFSYYFGWRMGRHYLPSKMGKYIYESIQITLLVSYLSILLVSLIFVFIINYSNEILMLNIGESLIATFITSFIGCIMTWPIAIPIGVIYGRYIRKYISKNTGQLVQTVITPRS